MAHVIFIHGAWHGGWCFDPLRPMLEAAGHTMEAPDLPGIGGSDAELASTTLAGWADYVADLVQAHAAPVVLAGHSRGGIVISEVAERVPERVAALVYICAMLIPSGASRADLKTLFGPNPAFDAIIQPQASGHATIINPVGAAEVFAQLSPPDLVLAAAKRLVAEPNAPRRTPLALTEARFGSVPRHYIECLHDRTIPINDQRAMQAMQPCTSVTALEADHSPFFSAPRALADALIAIATGETT
jgi:pimeloyl-ACP methyl ester carboxylesterase